MYMLLSLREKLLLNYISRVASVMNLCIANLAKDFYNRAYNYNVVSAVSSSGERIKSG